MAEWKPRHRRTLRVHAALLRLEGTRVRHRAALDAEGRFHTALLKVGLICFSLWAGFWVQFLVSIYYGLAGIHVVPKRSHGKVSIGCSNIKSS